MKKLLLFLIIFPIMILSQNMRKTTEGLIYEGDGKYKITEIGSSGFVGLDKIERRANEKLKDFCVRNNYNFKILNSERHKQSFGVNPKVVILFQVMDENNIIVLNKDEAKKKLLELKQLLDEEIITQQEYDKSASSYKKIILGL